MRQGFDLDQCAGMFRQSYDTFMESTFQTFKPSDVVLRGGIYEELNIFGSPTYRVAIIMDGERLPCSPRGFTWRSRRPISEWSPAQLYAKAAEYQTMAATASTADVMHNLLELAARLQELAANKDDGRPL